MHSYIIIDSIMYSKPLAFYVMRLSYFSNDKKSLSQQLFRFGKLFRKVLFCSGKLFRKVLVSFGKYFPKVISASVKTLSQITCRNNFPKKLFMCDMALTKTSPLKFTLIFKNSMTLLKNVHPLQQIKNIFDALRKSKYFYTLHFPNDYY